MTIKKGQIRVWSGIYSEQNVFVVVECVRELKMYGVANDIWRVFPAMHDMAGLDMFMTQTILECSEELC